MTTERENRSLRSQRWFDDPLDPGMTAIYLERYLNFGLTMDELSSARPIIGIAQTGNDLSPCNRIHVDLARRMSDGVRDAGGVALEFPMHPIQETGRRPTAALDRNLAYLGLVEVLHGYPIDGVILTTGCDKTTPAGLMAAATVDIPAIAINGGPMIDGFWEGQLVGAGTIVWEARKRHAAGDIDYKQFLSMAAAASPSAGHCNTMGTALSMNVLAEAMGMMLPGGATIPAPYRERGQLAYETGKRIVEMVREDLTPSKILTRDAFENAIVANSAIGGSSNCPIHVIAIARHMGIELTIEDWQTHGYDIPLLVNCQPAGAYLAEAFHRAGGLPAVMGELIRAGKINTESMTVSSVTIGDLYRDVSTSDPDVIRPYDDPLLTEAGFVVVSGNMFDSAIMKTSVISPAFRARYLSAPEHPNVFEARAIVFEGPEDYHRRINDQSLEIDDSCLLIIRGCGPIGYPGSAEVVNMQPPDLLIKAGVEELPTLGDGRQSGTSGSPSILNASPESVAGSGLAIVETGDTVRVDIESRRVDLLLDPSEIAARWDRYVPTELENQTPWQELHRRLVGQLSTGACFDMATEYRQVKDAVPRHSH